MHRKGNQILNKLPFMIDHLVRDTGSRRGAYWSGRQQLVAGLNRYRAVAHCLASPKQLSPSQSTADGRLIGMEGGSILPMEDLTCLRSEEHTSELQSRQYLVCRLLLEKKKTYKSHARLYCTQTLYTSHVRQSRLV